MVPRQEITSAIRPASPFDNTNDAAVKLTVSGASDAASQIASALAGLGVELLHQFQKPIGHRLLGHIVVYGPKLPADIGVNIGPGWARRPRPTTRGLIG